jgi:DnaJ-class molecular chaperone
MDPNEPDDLCNQCFGDGMTDDEAICGQCGGSGLMTAQDDREPDSKPDDYRDNPALDYIA